VQIVFQDANGSLDPKTNAEQAIQEPLENFFRLTRLERAHRVSELLHDVGLEDELRKRYPHQLSGGQRQRIVIARALAAEPEYLLCDEAISGLDADMCAQILTLLQDLCNRRNMGGLFITHDLASARKICRDTHYMHAGVIVPTAPEDEGCRYA
jgi:ABC-type dipeptide/oligopeptide/nickel transport system ATPase subunit